MIHSILTSGFKRELEAMSPERKSDPYVEAALRSVNQHLRESYEHSAPRSPVDDI